MGLIKDKYKAALLFLALAITGAAFLPVLHNGFVEWDDTAYVTQNQDIRNLSLQSVAHIFSSFHLGLYKPLVILSFAVERHFFGLNPFIYHADNLLFHLCNVALVFFLCIRLCNVPEIAFMTALLFGIHPMHAESVAWVSERKDMLYGMFFLLSFLFYLRYREGGGMRCYLVSCGAFALSLICKPMGVTLPFILLLADYYKGRELNRAALWDKLFYVLAAALVMLADLHAAGKANVYYVLPEGYTRLQSSLAMCYGFVLYVAKAFIPVGQAAVYPYPELLFGIMPAAYMLSPLPLALICGMAIFFAAKSREAMFGLAFFAAALAPGMQWLPVTPSVIFDHYTYISYIGIFFALAAFLHNFCRTERLKKIVAAFFFVVVAAFCILTWQRALVWRDTLTLWSDELSKYPESLIALNNRAYEFIKRGMLDAATGDLNRALIISPDNQSALVNRGNIFARKGDYGRALADYAAAEAGGRETATICNNRGNVLRSMGRYGEAQKEYIRAVELDPSDRLAHYNLSDIYNRLGNRGMAVEEYRRGLAIAPELAGIAPKPSGL
jgi:tetratricopeptide (TPR) repeat protein